MENIGMILGIGAVVGSVVYMLYLCKTTCDNDRQKYKQIDSTIDDMKYKFQSRIDSYHTPDCECYECKTKELAEQSKIRHDVDEMWEPASRAANQTKGLLNRFQQMKKTMKQFSA